MPRLDRTRRHAALAALGIGSIGLVAAIGGFLLWSNVLGGWLFGPSTAASQALQALEGLRSMTESGTNYQQYMARVTEAQVQLDRALGEMGATGNSEARRALELAMKLYVAAAMAWEATLMHQEGGWLGLAQELPRDAELPKCPAIRVVLDQAHKQREHEETFAFEALNIAPFWSCAADQVARAERLVAAGRP